MTLLIRDAIPEDLMGWSRLRTLLWPNTEDEHIAEISAYFNHCSTDIVQTFVLVDSTVDQTEQSKHSIKGFIELNIRHFAEGSREPKVPYVEGWYVDESLQGKGWGKQLMRRAESWARKLGYHELASDTEIDNRLSIDIHKQLGFVETERVVCFIKSLK